MDKSELLYKIGITLIPGVGDINAKKIIAYCGGAEAVFTEKFPRDDGFEEFKIDGRFHQRKSS